MTDDPLAIVRRLGAALELVGARWAVGGSLASSLHGLPRATADVDLVVAMLPSRTSTLARHASGFFIDAEILAAELVAGRSYNVFHEVTMTKVDLFPAVGAFERNQLARAVTLSGVRVVAAEDSVLAKLRWYRAGGETSERQWRDVLGVLDVQRGRLDRAHIERWAAELGVADLLERAERDTSAGL